MAHKKLKLLYLAQYFRQQTDEEHPKTVQEMIAYLEGCGITAERKSIYDDLQLLELWGMDIQMVRGKRFGYFLGQREFQLPELKLLIDVVQASPFLTGKKSMELIAKLEGLTSRYGARQLRRQVYVMNRLRTANETLYYTVDGINAAINENRQISFRYFDWTVEGKKAFRRQGQTYRTNPVALCVDRYYYLVAWSDGEYRHYRVDRIADLRVLEEPRQALPPDFDLGTYTKQIFDMYSAPTATVGLEFDEKLINIMIDRFGTQAHMRPAAPGRIQLTAEVEAGPTFYGWLCQFGTQAKLLWPQDTVDAFTRWCRETLAQYQ